MADLIQSSLEKVKGATDLVINSLDDNETFAYKQDAEQVMIIHNTSASTITPILKGTDASAAFKIYGYGTKDLTGGYEIGDILAGESVTIPLETIRHWIAGISSIENGTGATCIITTEGNLSLYDYIWLQGGRIVGGGKLTQNSRLWG